MKKKVCLLYHKYLSKNASTISEHISSFKKYMNADVVEINTEIGFPKELKNIEFDVVVLHYSLFGSFYHLDSRYIEYIKRS